MYRNNFAAGWMNLGTVKAALHKEDVSLIALFMFPQIIDYDLTFQQALFFCVTTGERPGAQVVVSQSSRERIKGILKSNLCLVLCQFSYFFPLILSARLFLPHSFELSDPTKFVS